jgi:hypothetical protein
MKMTTPSHGLDSQEKSPSRQSIDSKNSTRSNSKIQKDHGGDAILPSATGEPATEQVDRSHLVANEDYSVFTVGQKRAIIFAGSFAAWFSPMVSHTPPSTPDEHGLIFQ